jgi:hypothetical protein
MRNLIVILGLLISTNVFSQISDSTQVDSSMIKFLTESAVKNPYIKYTEESIGNNKIDTLFTNNLDTRDGRGYYEQTNFTKEKYRFIFFHNENLLVKESLQNNTLEYMFLKFDLETGSNGLNQIRYKDEKNNLVILRCSNQNDIGKILKAIEIVSSDGLEKKLYYK